MNLPSILTTTFTLGLGFPAVPGAEMTCSSGGRDGQFIQQFIREADFRLQDTQTFGLHNRVLAILRDELPRKFGREGWNGYGAKAVMPESVRFAAEFVRTMPFDLEDPLVRAVPSGCVCFSWRAGKERLCSVVFDTDGKYHCASIIGAFESAITTNDANEVIRKAMEVLA